MKQLILLIYYAQGCFAQAPTATPRRTKKSGAVDYDDTKSVQEVSAESTTTPEPTTVPPAVYTEFDFNKHYNVEGTLTDKEQEALTAQAFVNIANRTKKNEEEEGQVYDWWAQTWEDASLKTVFYVDAIQSVGHWESHNEKVKVCYTMGIAFKNSLTDLKKYYKIRYLYIDNLDYEVGFLVEEIIVHYQIAVELYHLMVRKYGLQRYRFYAPTTYMLYIYTNILQECKTIIHLCSMLHELEKKYKDPPKTIFLDYHILKTLKPKEKHEGGGITNYQLKILQERKRKLKAQKKERKKLFKSGLYIPTERTRQPKKGPFELHYGWSIEYW